MQLIGQPPAPGVLRRGREERDFAVEKAHVRYEEEYPLLNGAQYFDGLQVLQGYRDNVHYQFQRD